MIDFSISHTLAPVDAKIAATANPRHRALLENFRAHLVAELRGDVEAIMQTQCAEPQYHFYGSGVGDFGPKGGAAVRGFYENIFAQGYNKLRYDVERWVIDDRALFHEGWMHIVFPGRALVAMGIPCDDSSGSFVFSYRQSAIFHYDASGTCTGEDTYSDGPMTPQRLRRLTPEEEATLPR
ncbi:MAG: nuclear transport factor 2 family protein [Deltaproteobacteria bacterium]|nr:nuclear transport factor 2 family protein [Deltaproteobacteria bacterium]